MRNVPKLRFEGFSGEWEEKKLEDIGDLISGLTYSPDDVRDKGLLVLRSSNIQNDKLTLDDTVYVEQNTKGVNLSKSNDILICIRNGSKSLIGKNALIPNNMPLSTHGAFMAVFRTDIAKLVYQVFQTSSYRRQVDADLGATINSINGNNFKKYIFCIPKDEKEQQNIVSCFSSLDSLIETQIKKVEAFKKYKKGLMQQLFLSEGKKEPKLRFKVFTEGWKEENLDNIATYENGKAHEQNIEENGKYIVVNSKFISTDGKVRKYTNNAFSISEKNDILMVLSDVPNGRAIAKCFLVNEDNLYTVNQRICKISSNKIVSILLFYTLNRNKYFLNFDDGVKQTNLRREDVLSCPIFLPKDKNEQQKIANTLNSFDNLIQSQNQKIQALKKHKKALMQQLFVNNELDK